MQPRTPAPSPPTKTIKVIGPAAAVPKTTLKAPSPAQVSTNKITITRGPVVVRFD